MLKQEVLNYLEKRFPEELASDMDYDKTGLILGSPNLEVKNILLALDLTYEVVLEAINREANLIIVHHPFIFEAIFKIPYDTNLGKILKLMFEYKISLYVIHTALDVGRGGVNDSLARLLEIKDIKGTVEKDQFLRYGVIQPQFLEDFVTKVKENLNLKAVRIVGNPKRLIKTVGVVGGSGAHYSDFEAAQNAGLDCYITGEISHHMALYAKEVDLCLIEVAHAVESFVFVSLKNELIEELDLEHQVFISKVDSDPFSYL